MLHPSHVRHYLNFMAARGITAADVVAGTGIDPARLAEPDYLISTQQCHALISNLIRLSGDPSIGLEIGRATTLIDMGIVGYAMASSGTLGQAIDLWLQYGNSPVGFPFALRVFEDSDGSWGLSLAANGVSGTLFRFYVEETVSMGMAFGGLLTGAPFEIQELTLAYPEPEQAARYAQQFGCAIHYGARLTRVVVRSPSLQSAIKSNDSEMRELCIRQCSRLMQRISRHGPISSRLRSALTTMNGIPGLDAAAEAMNMSARTLRRQLQAEHTSFQRVLDEFRVDLAREYLQAGRMPPKQVAFLLGFSDVDSFRRAFKSWTGQTIRDFQRGTPSIASTERSTDAPLSGAMP